MTFNEIIHQDKPVLVDFFATWCGPCQTMMPVLEKVKKRIGDKAYILKVDVDKNRSTAAAFHIQSVPTLMLFKNGQNVWRRSGLVSAHDLESMIKTYE